MKAVDKDTRSPQQKALDERIAAEPKLPPPTLPSGTVALPMEDRLPRHARRPVAVAGIVENGLVRPLDPTVKLSERSTVIIVMSERT